MIFAATLLAGFAVICASMRAIYTDLRTRSIENWVSFIMIFSGIALHSMTTNPFAALGTGIVSAILIFIILFGLHKLKNEGMGLGDVIIGTAGVFAAGSMISTYYLAFIISAIALTATAFILQKRARKLDLEMVMSDDVEQMPRDLRHNLGCPEIPFGLAFAAASIVTSIAYIAAV